MKILLDKNVWEEIVEKLMKIMKANPYAKFFQKLKDVPSIKDVQTHITKDVNLDQRAYNSSTADQVAAIWIERNNPNISF